MGDPRYLEKIFALYGVKIGNIDEKLQTEILLVVKRFFTKKEYKALFQFMDESDGWICEKLNCEQADLDLMRKKGQRKLKDAKIQNSIMAILEAEEK